MHDHDCYSYYDEPMNFPIVKPNLITGEGRMRCRGSHWKDKQPDLKKKQHRKMAKSSRRKNRR